MFLLMISYMARAEEIQNILDHGTAQTPLPSSLSSTAKSQLATLAQQMNQDPNCLVIIEGNTDDTKINRQRSWDRVNVIINYMADELQINRSRFIFRYEGMGDKNSVNFRAAAPGETGSSNVLPPHPHLGSGN